MKAAYRPALMPAAHDAAQRAIEEQAILRLSAEDQQRFAEALIQPPAPNAALIGWMGRDLAIRRAGLGSMLLYEAISRVAKAPIGAYAICADAIDEAATVF
ncbi:MAG: DUF1778 domain-containing protein [Cyanobacteria bacterium]|nr:DUF1778 domain-containing protein [Cyanobacteriota bacterium]